MIVDLAFTRANRLSDGRVIRHLGPVRPTILQLEAVCRSANAVAERLAAHFACAVSVEVVEPIQLEGSMRGRLLGGAQILRVRGDRVDGFVIVRQRDARRLADFAFARRATEQAAPLSMLESRVVRRVLDDIAIGCAPLCGQLAGVTTETPQNAARDAAVYFEIRLLGPLHAAVGIAVGREPAAAQKKAVRVDDLRDACLEVRAVIGRGPLTLARLASLGIGSVVPLDLALDDYGTLEVGGRAIARGRCGVDRNRVAFQVTEPVWSAG